MKTKDVETKRPTAVCS